MKRIALLVLSHATAFGLGWLAVAGSSHSQPDPVDAPTPSVSVFPSPRNGDPDSSNPWLRATSSDYQAAWDDLLHLSRRPGETDRDADSFERRVEQFLALWVRVDPAAALDALGQVQQRKVTNLLRNMAYFAGEDHPDLFFEHVPRLPNLPALHNVAPLGEIARKVAANDPARAHALVMSLPAGQTRVDVLNASYEGLEEKSFEQFADRVRATLPAIPSHSKRAAASEGLADAMDRRGGLPGIETWLQQSTDPAVVAGIGDHLSRRFGILVLWEPQRIRAAHASLPDQHQDLAALAAVRQFTRWDKTDEASNWVNTINDPTLRERAAALLEK